MDRGLEVSTAVFAAVKDVLKKRHGDRLVDEADVDTLLELSTHIEDYWCCLPKANATLEMKGEPSE